MINLPPIEMPGEFCTFLQSSLQNNYEDQQKVLKFVRAYKSFSFLVTKYLGTFSDDGRIDSIISSLGPKQFRDRLAALYIYRFEYGSYTRPSLEWVDDVLEFEGRFRAFTISGQSRSFLLGLYLKFVHLKEKNSLNDDVKLSIPTMVYDVLKSSGRRSVRIDWLILVLWHMVEFLGEKRLKRELLSMNGTYEELYAKLSVEQKDLLMNNLLNYAYSINEPELFTQARI